MPLASALARSLRGMSWRVWLVAAGFFALGVLAYTTGVYSMGLGSSGAAVGWRLLVLAVGCVALILRIRAPLVALGIGLAVAAADVGLGLSWPVALLVGNLLYYAVLYSSRRASRLIVGVVTAASLAAAVAATAATAMRVPDWRLVVLVGLQVFAVPMIPVWWAAEVRQQREVAEAERERARQLEIDRRAAVAGERARMARDLHDVIAGQLSAIAIQSEAVLSMRDGDPDTVHAVLRSVRENSVRSLTEMRAMIDVLRTDQEGREVKSAGPFTAPARLRDLETLVESARAGGMRVAVTSDVAWGRDPADANDANDAHEVTEPELPAAVDLAAYRIVQEALTNAVKHASGARAWVTVNRAGDRLAVEVTNELTGSPEPSAPDGPGTGLASMRERAEATGGTLTAGRCANGWRVRAVLPVEPAEGMEA